MSELLQQNDGRGFLAYILFVFADRTFALFGVSLICSDPVVRKQTSSLILHLDPSSAFSYFSRSVYDIIHCAV